MRHALKPYCSGVLFATVMVMVFSSYTYRHAKEIKQGEPVITLAAYHTRIAGTHKAVLVYFSAGWCAVCPKFKPVMAEIEKEYKGKIELIRIDTERDVEIAEELDVNTLPLLILYKDGKQKWTSSGIMPISDIRREIDCYL